MDGLGNLVPQGCSKLSHHAYPDFAREIRLELAQSLALTLRALAILNVCQGPVPIRNLSPLVAQQDRSSEEPAILACGASIPGLGLERLAGSRGMQPLDPVSSMSSG